MNKTQIANRTLRNLGVSWTISDFDNDNSNHAKVIRNAFQEALDTVTEATEWSFASKTRDLPYLGEGKFGWAHRYSLPGDCLVLRKIGIQEYFIQQNLPKQFLPTWEFDNSQSIILCNVDKAWGKYTRRVMQDEEVPSLFGIAVAGRLSLNVAPALIGDKFAAIKESLKSALDDDMDRAIAYDSGRQPYNEQQVSSYELLLE